MVCSHCADRDWSLRDDGPAVVQEAHIAPPGIDHRFDGKGHARHELEPRPRFAVVQHLRILMIHAADAVSAVFAHHGEAVALRKGLDGVTDVAQVCARLDHLDTLPHGLVAGRGEAAGEHARGADQVHAAGVAVEALADHGHVDIDDVAALQALVARNAVADHVIDRGADGLREAPVVQVRRDGLELLDDEVVAALVELLGGHAGLHVGLDHVEHARRQAPGGAHFFLFFRGLDGDVHEAARTWFSMRGHGIKRGYF